MKKFKFILPMLVLIIFFNCTAFAKTGYPVLTLEEAVGRAYGNSESLKSISESRRMNELSNKDLKENIRESTNSDSILSLSVSIMKNDIESAFFNNDIETQKERLTISIEEFFSSIVAAEKDLELFEKELSIAKKELTIDKVKHNLGLMSDTDLANSKSNFEKKEVSRLNKEMAIEKAFISLNEIMGTSFDIVYDVSINYQYEPLIKMDTQNFVSNVVSGSPNLKKLKRELEVEEYQFSYFLEEAKNSSSKDTAEISMNKSYRSYDSKKNAVEKEIISLHNEIRNLENSYTSTNIELKNMKKQLEINKKKVELGKLTELDLEKYQLQIEQKEEELRSLIASHNIMKTKLLSPSLY